MGAEEAGEVVGERGVVGGGGVRAVLGEGGGMEAAVSVVVAAVREVSDKDIEMEVL